MDGSSTAAADESSAILASLEGGGGRGLYGRVASFLLPFGDLIPLDSHDPAAGPKKKDAATTTTTKKKARGAAASKRSTKKDETEAAVLRPLAKRFLPFLSRALKLLPSALRRCLREEEDGAGELFAVYRLVLDCLASVSPCLACKPFSVHLQRGSLVRCLETWGNYSEAEEEGVSLLENLVSVVSSSAPTKPQKGRTAKCATGGHLLPDSTMEGARDPELAILVVDVVASLIRCTYRRKMRDEVAYRRILLMVQEVQPWLMLLESESFEKYQSSLVNALHKCSLLLAGECMSFDATLVYDFCLAMLKELLKSSSKDQFPKIACQICSSICHQWESRALLMLEMLRYSLGSISCKCKVNVVYMINQLFEFIHYIVDNCRTANLDVQEAACGLLYEWRSNLHVVSSPVASVLGIYATGLNYTTRSVHPEHRDGIIGCSESSDAASLEVLDGTEQLQSFADSLNVLGHYFRCSGGAIDDALVKCLRNIPPLAFECKAPKCCDCIHGKVSLLSYLDALGFLWKQLEDHVNKAWKHMISEKMSFHSADMNYIQNAFSQFCDFFLSEFRCSEKSERERLHESHLILVCATVTSLKISLGTGEGIKSIVTCIDHVISCEWIESQELKHLASSFYNIGASLYNVGQVDKASVAFQLCCTTLWTHAKLLCQLFLEKSPSVHNSNLSKDVIKDAIADACAKSAIALDVMHQCGNADLHHIVISTLLSWSAADELLETSTGPFVLVKQWVKVVCKDTKDVDVVDSVPALYPFLLNECKKLSKRTLGFILEQELLAYEELDGRYPNLCQKMQFRLIDVLLNNIYVTDKYSLPRSRILVKKGHTLRTCGIDGLNSSLECLSEAISLLEAASNDASGSDVLLHHQLALTYFLHAHCAQEANKNMEVILHDIGCALSWWPCISKDIHHALEYEKTIQLLCSIADLMVLKGHLHFQLEICKLIIVFSKRKSVPVERCLDILWSNRRFSHTFCSSPLDENFIVNMSEELDVHANSISFWMSCMKSSPSSLVGFLQSFSLSESILPEMSILNSENSVCPCVTVEEVKKAASSLISSVPVAIHSAFVAGYLLFDLSERLLSVGRLFEALSYAREALQLRRRVLQRKFIYSLGQHPGKVGTTWNIDLFTEAIGSVITEDWPNFSKSQSFEDCIISPWSILRCYLESILQVGILCESIGNGVEAEALLRIGKNVSCSLGFPVLAIAFLSHLGRVYCKQQFFDLAENQFNMAKKTLLENNSIISCKRCKVVLEGTIDLQIGDLHRSIFENTSIIQSIDSLSNAIRQYRSALEKLNLIELGSSFGGCVKTKSSGSFFRKSFTNEATLKAHCAGEIPPIPLSECAKKSGYILGHSDGPKLRDHCTDDLSKLENEGSNINSGGRRKPKIASRHPSRKHISNDESNLNTHYKDQTHYSHSRNSEWGQKCNVLTHNSACPDTCRKDGTHLEPSEELQQIYGCSEASRCTKTNCWRCFLVNVMEAGSMYEIIYAKWECQRRCLSVRLLSKIGKCMGVHSESHEVHEIFWRSMSLLFNREPLYQTSTSSLNLLEFVGMENTYDIFPVQRALLLYNMGFFCIRDCLSEGSRTKCCSLSKTEIPRVLSWLLTAFILTREIPFLFQKVSRLIAAILLLSMSNGHFSFPFSFESLTGSHLAAFFHQASVGTYIQHMHISSKKDKGSNSMDVQNVRSTGKFASSGYIRVAPEKLSDLEEFVSNFFKGLPSFTIICISLLGGDYVNLLGETLLLPSFFPAWMLLSRLDQEEQPIVMMLPVDFIPEEIQADANCTPRSTSEDKESITKWKCPWSYTLVDYVAPQYKLILEANYLSLSETTCDASDAQRNRSMWWSKRTSLNDRLSKFLRSMEDWWLGPWRCLLLGQCSDVKCLDSVLSRLSQVFESECQIKTITNVLKVILGGGQSLLDVESCISQLLVYKGCLGRGGCCRAESFRAVSPAIDGRDENVSETARRLIVEAIGELAEEKVNREPVILVFDADLQMLPWENMPALRKQEVYRMPSVSSISAALDRNCHNKQAGTFDAFIPSIDPLDAYYLLNPSGDLYSTQTQFEEWFRDQKWEGKAGNAPTAEELAEALQNHDLFLYFGHGSGTQYIPGSAIQRLNNCAATLLMGCSSGSLSLKGCYAPHGAPLSYLLAGSPAVIANLWEVSDKDIDRFGKAMLNSWLQEPITAANCTQCNRRKQEYGRLDIDVGSSRYLRTRRKAPRDEKPQESRQNICWNSCKTIRIASFMSQARDVCRLPLLIGASPVCYGIPTLIRNHKIDKH